MFTTTPRPPEIYKKKREHSESTSVRSPNKEGRREDLVSENSRGSREGEEPVVE